MGWIKSTPYRIGVGAVQDATEVTEPAGFTGERVTPTGQRRSPIQEPFKIDRRGRVVYATREEAIEATQPSTLARCCNRAASRRRISARASNSAISVT